MSFTSIPPELIHQISTYLPPSSLSTLAHLTRLTYQTLHKPLLVHLLALHNKNTLLHRHGPVTTRTYSTHTDTTPNLEYLRLNGDLHWLLPLDAQSMLEHVGWPRGTALSPSTINSLESLASTLGVKFPVGFLRFMGDQELIDSMWLGGNYFTISQVKKCLPKDDGGRGGYMVMFFSDQQGCYYWSLYLSTDGLACVMGSVWNVECDNCRYRHWQGWPEHEDPKVEEGTGVLVSCQEMEWELVHWSWEEWLCTKYFDRWNNDCLRRGSVLGETQVEFADAAGNEGDGA